MGGYLLEQGQLIAVPPKQLTASGPLERDGTSWATISFMVNVEGVNLMQIATVSS